MLPRPRAQQGEPEGVAAAQQRRVLNRVCKMRGNEKTPDYKSGVAKDCYVISNFDIFLEDYPFSL